MADHDPATLNRLAARKLAVLAHREPDPAIERLLWKAATILWAAQAPADRSSTRLRATDSRF